MKRLIPQSLSGQFILLLVGALVLSQVLNVYFLIGERRVIARGVHYEAVIDRIVEEASDLPAYSRDQLPLQLKESGRFRGSIFLSTHKRTDFAPDSRPVPRYAALLEERLRAVGVSVVSTAAVTGRFNGPRSGPPPNRRPPPRDFHRPGPPPDARSRLAPGMEEIVFSAEIEPGIWLNALAPHYSVETLTTRAVLTTLLTLLVAALAAGWLARRIMKPIRDLGVAAETLGRGGTVEPIAETGPKDMRAATLAFNKMQQRLTSLIEEQRATLRAVGHDLRTPLTSLRIRAEDLPEEHGRSKFIEALDDLSVMTDEILGWSKDASATEDTVPVDLTSLLDSITQDYADQGRNVVFIEPGRSLIVPCRRVGLRRAITNLIDNALKYGGEARLSVIREDEFFRIRIDDNGSGIPVERIADVLTPFTRLESSRNRDTGGIGLGLSIAQSIVQNHGGLLILSNRPEGGLRATISLPQPVNG